MIPSLAPAAAFLSAPLSNYLDAFVLADDPRPGIRVSELLRPDVLPDFLCWDGTCHERSDRRAVCSLWSLAYFHRLIPLTVMSGALLGLDLPVGMDETEVIFDEHRMPVAIRLPHEGEISVETDPFIRFDPLVREHLEPMVTAVSRAAGISQKLLWNNAGHLLEWLLGELSTRTVSACASCFRNATCNWNALVRQQHWPDGDRNCLFDPVRYELVDGQPVSWRKVCCIRYLLPEHGFCSYCPHLRAKAGADLSSTLAKPVVLAA
ncbi:ferric iron reductase protein FhuF [Faunimonas pinastri]|uniref:Ferric iron reductase protein FhuF n=1 Tax=Faunimonas pinastri TaxID=1855383 RepID=A0A1H9FXX7_9HYPH|nr:siderophore-iron reductase FhuF [Faunimonas pinastri]SEQ42746.1 ferric iron reductase protein FhuF [Faunimonas pinastri]